jgi:hypothetical protein
MTTWLAQTEQPNTFVRSSFKMIPASEGEQPGVVQAAAQLEPSLVGTPWRYQAAGK